MPASVIIPGNSETREPASDLFERTAAATPPSIGGLESPTAAERAALPPGPADGLVTPEVFGAYVKAGVEALVFALGADEVWLMDDAELELISPPGAQVANKWLPEILRRSDFLEKWQTEFALVMAVGVVVNAKMRRFREKQERVMASSPRTMPGGQPFSRGPGMGPGMAGTSGHSGTPIGTETSSTAGSPVPANPD